MTQGEKVDVERRASTCQALKITQQTYQQPKQLLIFHHFWGSCYTPILPGVLLLLLEATECCDQQQFLIIMCKMCTGMP